jgi:molybdenum cofactor biosynthesis protein B
MTEHVERREEHSVGSVSCWVITVSDTRVEATDTTGRFICEQLTAAGHRVARYAIIKNDAVEIKKTLALFRRDSEAQAAIFHGGTGLSRKDQTARVLKAELDELIEGFGEIFRILSHQAIGPYALLSRALAGVLSGKLIFALPGSENAVKLAMEKLILPVLPHAVHELSK